jgi:hypothetical protein
MPKNNLSAHCLGDLAMKEAYISEVNWTMYSSLPLCQG